MITKTYLQGLALLLLTPFAAQAQDCELQSFEAAAASSPYGVTLTSAKRLGESETYCRLEGNIANAEDGKSQIKFRLRLPDAGAWNSKFMVLGNGGTAGMFQGEARVQVALDLGYATAQTDTGHTADGPPVWLMKEVEPGVVVPNNVTIDDFAHRAIHLTTVIGKQFVDVYYAQAPSYSYYFGCSTGGRQGLKAIQRYPNDFDGVVAGAPVFSLTRLNMSQLWTAQQSQKLEAKNQSLSGEQLKMVKAAVLNACDALDGLKDGIIDDPRQCDFDPVALQCEGSQSPPQCLTDSQVEFVRAVYRGPVTKAGERIYPGRPRGGEGAGRAGWSFLGPDCRRCGVIKHAWYRDPDMDLVHDFSIDDPDDVVTADANYYSQATRADNPDVTPFVQGGGKAILYHGWTDTNVTPIPTVELYEAMEDTVSRKRGKPDFRDHVRLFMAPGMGHCGGGDGPNSYSQSVLEAIDAWVAEGEAPESIVATHEARGLSRPWCPYPQVARLTEPNLDPNKAENFRCVSPAE